MSAFLCLWPQVQQVGSDLLEHKERTEKLIVEHKKHKERTEELIVKVLVCPFFSYIPPNAPAPHIWATIPCV